MRTTMLTFSMVWILACSGNDGDGGGSDTVVLPDGATADGIMDINLDPDGVDLLAGDLPKGDLPRNPLEDTAGVDLPEVDTTGKDAAPDVEPEELQVTFLQAVQGAMWANPTVYPKIPIRIGVQGAPTSLEVTVAGAPVGATEVGDGTWLATVNVSTMGGDPVEVTVTATPQGGGPEASDVAELVLGQDGVQLTQFGEGNTADTPALHRVGDQLWLTWADRSEGAMSVWLQKIDGAARSMGNKIALVQAEEEILAARVAVGGGSVGVLYQTPGMPYLNHFTAVDTGGAELLAPMSLDPEGWTGAPGGTIVHDGEAFVLTWRSQEIQEGLSEIKWMRVMDGTWEATGPVTITSAGAGTAEDPMGGFLLFMIPDVASNGDVSMVAFTQDVYSPLLELNTPRSYLALLDNAGTLLFPEGARMVPGDFQFAAECRTASLGDGFLAISIMQDLLSYDPNPPHLMYSIPADATGNPDFGLDLNMGGELMFDQPDYREEPTVLPHPNHPAVMAWFDHRAFGGADGPNKIALHTAPLEEDWSVTDEVAFEHPTIVSSSSSLQGLTAGSNVLLVWVDQRHGGGVADPKPEIWFETVWY